MTTPSDLLTRTIFEVAPLLAAREGHDAGEPATRCDAPVDYLVEIARGAAGLRIGVDRDYCTEDTDPDMREACFRAFYVLHGQKMVTQGVSLLTRSELERTRRRL